MGSQSVPIPSPPFHTPESLPLPPLFHQDVQHARKRGMGIFLKRRHQCHPVSDFGSFGRLRTGFRILDFHPPFPTCNHARLIKIKRLKVMTACFPRSSSRCPAGFKPRIFPGRTERTNGRFFEGDNGKGGRLPRRGWVALRLAPSAKNRIMLELREGDLFDQSLP